MFSYISGHTYLYRMSAVVKFILLIAVEVAVFLTPLYISVVALFLGLVIAFSASLSVHLFLKDLKGAVVYSLFIVLIDVLSFLINEHTLYGYNLSKSSLVLILRLSVMVMYTSLFFRSTSSLEIEDSLEKCERFFRKNKSRYVLSKTIATFLSFIPLLFSIWNTVNIAYTARRKKNSPFKIVHLFPLFITASLQKAVSKEAVLKAREP